MKLRPKKLARPPAPTHAPVPGRPSASARVQREQGRGGALLPGTPPRNPFVSAALRCKPDL
eukprot:2219766-Alexandrium_andersonii.AAC.1